MSTPRFILLGGFLGAGKTTTIARLARRFQADGLRVGIVTNDQATDLVDTFSLRAQGFDVGEVPGSCFCCNFNALTHAFEQLNTGELPDVILAEPVGSCTDLVATVVRPLARVYRRPLEIAPYGVLLKPSHGEKILGRRGAEAGRHEQAPRGGFSPEAEYIFHKQIEEADFVVLNRVDQLAPAQVERVAALVGERYPERPVLRMSAKTGEGFDAFFEFLAQRGRFGQRAMEVDYDTYAVGEAELGWLNSALTVVGRQPFALDDLLLDLVRRAHQRLNALAAEVAHLKVIGLADGAYAVANLVDSALTPELSLASGVRPREAQLVINARVALDPAALERVAREAADEACAAADARAAFTQTQSFRPGRPVPTHRLVEAV